MSEETASNGSRADRYADVDTSHLDDVEDGCGCAEVWEHTSDERVASRERENEADAEADAD